MDSKQSQQHRQHFNLSESAKQMLEVLTAQRYPGRQRRQSQLVEDLITEAFTKERSMSIVTTAMHEPEPEDNSEDIFWQEVRHLLLKIEENLSQLALSPTDSELLEELYRWFHTIAGSASMMNFPLIAQVAYEWEECLGDMLDGTVKLTESTLKFLQRALRRLWQLVDNGGKDVNNAVLTREENESSSSGLPSTSLPQVSRCPSCTQKTQANWKHCVYCGTSLVCLCSQCGTLQPELEGSRFCYECGNQLA